MCEQQHLTSKTREQTTGGDKANGPHHGPFQTSSHRDAPQPMFLTRQKAQEERWRRQREEAAKGEAGAVRLSPPGEAGEKTLTTSPAGIWG